MEISTTFSTPFLRSSLPPNTKIFIPRTSFGVKTTDIDNQYHIYSRTCAYRSFIIEVVGFTVSYAPVSGIKSLCIIIAVASIEFLILFILDISNAFQNIIFTNPVEKLYLSLPYLYLDWYKIKWPKHPLASSNQK